MSTGRWQFSLRALLFVVTLSAIVVASFTWDFRQGVLLCCFCLPAACFAPAFVKIAREQPLAVIPGLVMAMIAIESLMTWFVPKLFVDRDWSPLEAFLGRDFCSFLPSRIEVTWLVPAVVLGCVGVNAAIYRRKAGYWGLMALFAGCAAFALHIVLIIQMWKE